MVHLADSQRCLSRLQAFYDPLSVYDSHLLDNQDVIDKQRDKRRGIPERYAEIPATIMPGPLIPTLQYRSDDDTTLRQLVGASFADVAAEIACRIGPFVNVAQAAAIVCCCRTCSAVQ